MSLQAQSLRNKSHRAAGVDVAVVGGGLTGLALACLLADAGVSVLVVEARAAAAPPGTGAALRKEGSVADPGINPAAAAGYGIRTSSISPASQRVLERIGAWQLVPGALRTPYLAMCVWENESARPLEFDAAEAGMHALGHIVDNDALLRALEQAVSARPGITWQRPARLRSLSFTARDVELDLDVGRLHARLVVGADGSRSGVREDAGIGVRERDFEQRALVTIVHCAGGHEHTAWQRFIPTGPLALLPLPGDHCSLIWSTTPTQAEAMEVAEPRLLEDTLNTLLGSALGPFSLAGPRASFPLHAIEARSYVAPRVALVGDAAHTVHPLAGQGVNLGLLDAASLAEVVADQQGIGRDIGLVTNLRAFERRCRGRNLAMSRAIEGLHAVFGQRAPFASELRSAAFSLVDRSRFAKRWFIRAASGELGELPAAASPLRPVV